MLETREIHPLTDFLRNHKSHMVRLKESKKPEILTINGHAEIVILDVDSYHNLVERLHHMETITAIRDGIASAERGDMKPAEQVFSEMKARYGIQG